MEETTYSIALSREDEMHSNVYVVNAFTGISVVLFIVGFLNELGIFEINNTYMRISFLIAVIGLIISRVIIHIPVLVSSRWCKYLLLSFIIIFTFVLTILLSSYAAIVFVLPLLLSVQYRSLRFTHFAMIGSCIPAVFSPIIAFKLGTYSLKYFTGYLETACKVSVSISEIPAFSDSQAITRILLYMGVPQALMLMALSIFLFSVTKNRMENYRSRLEIAALNRNMASQVKRLSDMQDDALLALAQIIESRDENTGGHIHRASEIVRLICSAMLADPLSEMKESLASSMQKAAPLHDLGKIAIDDVILKKPGPLTRDEWTLIKKHPGESVKIIRQTFKEMEGSEFMRVAVNMALYHHERMDGKGYPEGIRGSEIPIEARVMALADVFDAILSKRSYKEAVPFDTACRIIRAEMPDHLDEKLLPYFEQVKEQIRVFYI